MRAKLKSQIYEIWIPESNVPYGYRWSLKGKRVEIYSPKIFSSPEKAEKDQQLFIHDNLSDVTITYDRIIRDRSNIDFLV